MMFYCPFCGARRFTCWPEFWPWQYQGDLFCSENCWICDATKKQRERNGYKMARMKKDGTPAKRPGPKAKKPTIKLDGELRIETPEAKKVEVVETPENVVKVIETQQLKLKKGLRGLNESDFEVSAIRHPQLGEFYYDKKFNSIDWRTPEGEEISLHPSMWKELYMIIPDVMGILQVVDGDE